MTSIGLRPFSEILGDIGSGDMERRLSSQLAEIVEAVTATGKNGKLVLAITVARDGKMIRVVADSKTTVPRESIEATSFFSDERGGLHRENPRQGKLGLEAVQSWGGDQ